MPRQRKLRNHKIVEKIEMNERKIIRKYKYFYYKITYRSPNPDLKLELPLELVPSITYQSIKPEGVKHNITFQNLNI